LIPFANWTNAGVYHVVASNVFGSTIGPAIVLTVLRTPLRFEDYPSGAQITNGVAHLFLAGASGVGSVVLLASSDLLAWEPILTNPPVIGLVQFVDTTIAGHNPRFYRAFEGVMVGPPHIEIAAPAPASGCGSFPLRVTGLTAAGPVIIYASSNLVDWQALFTNPPTIGPLQYLEGPSTIQPRRFYRVSEGH